MNISDLKQVISRLRATTPEVMKDEVLSIVRKNEDTATNMITDQLFAGKLGNGQDMPNYSEVSVHRFGKRPGPYQLYESGDFYRGVFVQAQKFPIFFDDKDRKTPSIFDLIESKGLDSNEILSLNKENFTDLGRSYVLPDLQNWFKFRVLQIR